MTDDKFKREFEYEEKRTENFVAVQTSFLGLARQFERMNRHGYNFLAMTQNEDVYTIIFVLFLPELYKNKEEESETSTAYSDQPVTIYPTIPINPQ